MYIYYQTIEQFNDKKSHKINGSLIDTTEILNRLTDQVKEWYSAIKDEKEECLSILVKQRPI